MSAGIAERPTTGGGSPERPIRPTRPGSPGARPPRRSAAAERRAERRGAWTSTAAVVLTLGVALLGLSPLLQGVGWWIATMAMVVVVLGAMAAVRGRGAPETAVVLVGAILWAALVVMLYASSTLWFLLPTFDTVGDLSGDLAAAQVSIAVQEIPAVADPPITQLIVMSVGLIAVISDALATGLRVPVLSGIGPLAVLSIAPLVRRAEPNVWVYLGTGAAFLLLIWCGSRIGSARSGEARPSPVRASLGGRNPALALGLGAATLAATLALPAITPGLTADSLADDGAGSRFPSIYSTGVDPTIQLGRDLRRSNPVLSLTYTTTSTEGLYLKMVNLGDFSTGTWEPEQPFGAIGYEGQDFGTPPGLAPDVPVEQASTTVSIAGLRSDWLPLPYPAQRVDDLAGDWLLTPETFTVTDLRGDTRGLNYTVDGLTLQPTPGQLAEAGAEVPDAVEGFLELPEGLPPVIAETAAAVAEGAATNYDRAVALQEYFRSGQFRYSLSAPDSGGYDGDTAAMIAAFLDLKEGYCVHFSASMAVMARTLGIPSRIAVGYAPGQNADATADGLPVYEVFTDQLHAWPELYFDGIGWLPFEPTPGLDITPPDYSLPDYAQSGGPGAAPTAPSAASTTAPDAGPDRSDTGAVQTPEQIALGQFRGWAAFLAVVGAVALLVLTPLGLRRLRRRGRLRALDTAAVPGTVAWTELEDTLDDYRVKRSAGDTLLDLEHRIRDDHQLPIEPVDRMRAQVEFEQYAPPGATGAEERARLRADLLEVIAALEAGGTAGERAKARLLPVSLLRRRRTAAAPGALVP